MFRFRYAENRTFTFTGFAFSLRQGISGAA